ncbi:MAG: CoA pyrophosphatase [FCB group bacterium]|jgi:8-oxo-dGTP pyrophosphatase MutT (NUDIX family)
METNDIDFIDFLRQRLKEQLPGQTAHLEMAPLIKEKPFRTLQASPDAIVCAVLVLLFQNKIDKKINVLLTLRSKNINHSGQISFPGGRSENSETAIETALRETEEEIGIHPNLIQILGTLSQLYVPPSNSLITPIVGFISDDIIFNTNSDEVDEVFSVPLDTLLNDDFLKRETWKLDYYEIDVPFWDIHHSTPLWGATAMMLKELLTLYQEFQNKLQN